MYVYIACKADNLELPFAIADSAQEIARLAGVKKSTVHFAVSTGASGKKNGVRFFKIDIGDLESDENE